MPGGDPGRVTAGSPKLVFIHGIGGPRDAEVFRAAWLDALALGAVAAGHGEFAEALRDGRFDVEFVSYGALFERADQQGTGLALTDAEREQLTDLLREVVAARRAAAPADDQRVQATLTHLAAQLDPPGQPQGVLAPVKTLLNVATTMVSIPPMRRAGQWLTAKAMLFDLSQVARYLSRGENDCSGFGLDTRIRRRFIDAIGAGPTVVVAHSLGSVVAFESLHQVATDVPLFVTIGSPIGLRAAVWPHLVPRPPCTPEVVARWRNFWDRDDIIAVNPKLERRVKANSSGVLPHSARVDSDGLWVHDATKYLVHADVAGPVAEAMKQHSQRR